MQTDTNADHSTGGSKNQETEMEKFWQENIHWRLEKLLMKETVSHVTWKEFVLNAYSISCLEPFTSHQFATVLKNSCKQLFVSYLKQLKKQKTPASKRQQFLRDKELLSGSLAAIVKPFEHLLVSFPAVENSIYCKFDLKSEIVSVWQNVYLKQVLEHLVFLWFEEYGPDPESPFAFGDHSPNAKWLDEVKQVAYFDNGYTDADRNGLLVVLRHLLYAKLRQMDNHLDRDNAMENASSVMRLATIFRNGIQCQLLFEKHIKRCSRLVLRDYFNRNAHMVTGIYVSSVKLSSRKNNDVNENLVMSVVGDSLSSRFTRHCAEKSTSDCLREQLLSNSEHSVDSVLELLVGFIKCVMMRPDTLSSNSDRKSYKHIFEVALGHFMKSKELFGKINWGSSGLRATLSRRTRKTGDLSLPCNLDDFVNYELVATLDMIETGQIIGNDLEERLVRLLDICSHFKNYDTWRHVQTRRKAIQTIMNRFGKDTWLLLSRYLRMPFTVVQLLAEVVKPVLCKTMRKQTVPYNEWELVARTLLFLSYGDEANQLPAGSVENMLMLCIKEYSEDIVVPLFRDHFNEGTLTAVLWSNAYKQFQDNICLLNSFVSCFYLNVSNLSERVRPELMCTIPHWEKYVISEFLSKLVAVVSDKINKCLTNETAQPSSICEEMKILDHCALLDAIIFPTDKLVSIFGDFLSLEFSKFELRLSLSPDEDVIKQAKCLIAFLGKMAKNALRALGFAIWPDVVSVFESELSSRRLLSKLRAYRLKMCNEEDVESLLLFKNIPAIDFPMVSNFDMFDSIRFYYFSIKLRAWKSDLCRLYNSKDLSKEERYRQIFDYVTECLKLIFARDTRQFSKMRRNRRTARKLINLPLSRRRSSCTTVRPVHEAFKHAFIEKYKTLDIERFQSWLDDTVPLMKNCHPCLLDWCYNEMRLRISLDLVFDNDKEAAILTQFRKNSSMSGKVYSLESILRTSDMYVDHIDRLKALRNVAEYDVALNSVRFFNSPPFKISDGAGISEDIVPVELIEIIRKVEGSMLEPGKGQFIEPLIYLITLSKAVVELSIGQVTFNLRLGGLEYIMLTTVIKMLAESKQDSIVIRDLSEKLQLKSSILLEHMLPLMEDTDEHSPLILVQQQQPSDNDTRLAFNEKFTVNVDLLTSDQCDGGVRFYQFRRSQKLDFGAKGISAVAMEALDKRLQRANTTIGGSKTLEL